MKLPAASASLPSSPSARALRNCSRPVPESLALLPLLSCASRAVLNSGSERAAGACCQLASLCCCAYSSATCVAVAASCRARGVELGVGGGGGGGKGSGGRGRKGSVRKSIVGAGGTGVSCLGGVGGGAAPAAVVHFKVEIGCDGEGGRGQTVVRSAC